MRTRQEIEKYYNQKIERNIVPIGEILETLLDIRDLLQDKNSRTEVKDKLGL